MTSLKSPFAAVAQPEIAGSPGGSNVSDSSSVSSITSSRRRIVGFERSRSMYEGLNQQSPRSAEPHCELRERPQRQSSLGQQLLLHNHLEKNKPPKLALTINATKRNARLKTSRSTSLQQPNETLPETTAVAGTLPTGASNNPFLQMRDQPFADDLCDDPPTNPALWLSRASTAPEPIPIPEMSPRDRARRSATKPPSGFPPSPVAVIQSKPSLKTASRLGPNGDRERSSGDVTPVSTNTNNLMWANSGRRVSGNTPVVGSGPARMTDLELARAAAQQAERHAAALQSALNKERQEVVRLRQELRQLALHRSSDLPSSYHPSREATPTPSLPSSPMLIDNNPMPAVAPPPKLLLRTSTRDRDRDREQLTERDQCAPVTAAALAAEGLISAVSNNDYYNHNNSNSNGVHGGIVPKLPLDRVVSGEQQLHHQHNALVDSQRSLSMEMDGVLGPVTPAADAQPSKGNGNVSSSGQVMVLQEEGEEMFTPLWNAYGFGLNLIYNNP